MPIDTASPTEAEQGRIETCDWRILDVSSMEDKDVSGRWPGLKTTVEVRSTGIAETIWPRKSTVIYKRRGLPYDSLFQYAGMRTLVNRKPAALESRHDFQGERIPCKEGGMRLITLRQYATHLADNKVPKWQTQHKETQHQDISIPGLLP